MQVTQSGKKCMRFIIDEKVLALSLYKTSPRAYRLLNEICILLKRKTLQGVLQNLNLRPGINSKMMEHLKRRVKNYPQHRYCSIIFNEMAIAPSLSYDKIIVSFVEDGSEIIADHVLVFMVRGVIKKI